MKNDDFSQLTYFVDAHHAKKCFIRKDKIVAIKEGEKGCEVLLEGGHVINVNYPYESAILLPKT